jgi:predicted methyltransferase
MMKKQAISKKRCKKMSKKGEKVLAFCFGPAYTAKAVCLLG